MMTLRRIHPGDVVGDLTVLYETGTRDSHGRVQWLCRCSCGRETIKNTQHLTNKTCAKNCGAPQHAKYVFIHPSDVIGSLTVISKKNSGIYHCKCSCGKECDVKRNYLRTSPNPSCGCKSSVRVRNDLTGKRFGRWTVLERVEKTRPVKYLCRCDCGTVRKVAGFTLTRGASLSCGCYGAEVRGKAVEEYWKKRRGSRLLPEESVPLEQSLKSTIDVRVDDELYRRITAVGQKNQVSIDDMVTSFLREVERTRSIPLDLHLMKAQAAPSKAGGTME